MQRLVVIFVFALGALAAFAANNKLNLFIWSEYIDPEIVAGVAAFDKAGAVLTVGSRE